MTVVLVYVLVRLYARERRVPIERKVKGRVSDRCLDLPIEGALLTRYLRWMSCWKLTLLVGEGTKLM